MSTVQTPPRALLSVWNKTGIVDFARGLADLGFELVSTGGTARTLTEAGLDVLHVSDLTEHPEIFDGRVKSLHPAIHGPLLARLHQKDDAAELDRLGYAPIRVVACNLYPFAAAAKQDPPLDDPALLEMIDIGGPTMVRASAKNHQHVLIATNPERYDAILNALRQAGSPEHVSIDMRRTLALEAFQHTAVMMPPSPMNCTTASWAIQRIKKAWNRNETTSQQRCSLPVNKRSCSVTVKIPIRLQDFTSM